MQIFGIGTIGAIGAVADQAIVDFGLATALLAPILASLLAHSSIRKHSWTLVVGVVVLACAAHLRLIGWLDAGNPTASLSAALAFAIAALVVADSASRLNAAFTVYDSAQINAYRHLIEHVQDAVLRALRFYDAQRDGNERAWLLAIVRNCCYTWHRRRKPDRLSMSYSDAEAAPQLQAKGQVDAQAVQASEQAVINRALALLPAEYREVVVLREVQNLSYREISDVTGVPMGTVMSRLARARKQLASLLRPHILEAG